MVLGNYRYNRWSYNSQPIFTTSRFGKRPLTAAERQRRYRERLKLVNPEKWEEMRKKNLLRTKMKYRPVNQLNEVEKTIKRREWRRFKRNIRVARCEDQRKRKTREE
ncbi:unnamed protein product [Parnassius apollo]|uniref:(apollo) hypothetical protein n=1 Tax=Parnassius apollo TaxID=110799 RepID=A0A8S3W0W3_PARAO|nr:unnamed protein product [Parnassius apollo]